MKLKLFVLAPALAWCGGLVVGASVARLCERWESAYAGKDATGDHVVALWQFTPGSETDDASGHGHKLRLDGAEVGPGGLFGSCLECYRGWPVEDKRHAALVANDRALTPEGAFTLEMWLRPKPELKDYPESFLLDKKYVSHNDYQLVLSRADRSGARRLRACLGFGADSATYFSKPLKLELGGWVHVAFTYDGAGTGSFYLNGVPWGSTHHSGRRSISPGRHPLSIGDRIGSYYHGFPGFIDQVRISTGVLEFRRAKVELISDRTCFVRMEKAPPLRLGVTNLRRASLSGGVVELSMNGFGAKKIEPPKLDSGQAHTVEYRLDTSLRPNTYKLTARLSVAGPKSYDSEESFAIRIVPRRLPHRFPVVMWGVYSPANVLKEIDRLKRIGFTHVIGLSADYGKIWKESKPMEAAKPGSVEQTKRMLDEALANGLSIVASLSPGSFMRRQDKFLRVDRKGKPYKRKDICGLFPELRPFCHNVGASVARTYGAFPAFQAALLHTEVRDHAAPCFHAHDRAAYRKHAETDIPPEVTSRWGVHYSRLRGFPSSRVIPDDHPIYRYYLWYWKHGDGWNALNTALHGGLRSTGRRDLWTFHDPAVRVASVYGSGGAVDVLSQWTYSYPDPLKLALATDELLAMAAGASHRQRVMKMTQIIWYRSQTAPKRKEGAGGPAFQARWEREQPDAPFITIAPMHLREAFWMKIARPIRGIMYHGWQSLVPCEPPRGYRFTHPQTQHELARLIREVVQPLGPTLLQIAPVKGDVAFLESFASQVFAGRGTYGWGGKWLADAYYTLLYAGLQPEIVYDETIMQRGLDGFRVLVMADCDVITETMAERIKAFQKREGIVVGDERLAPALKPDVLLKSYQRTKKAAEDKAALLARAAKLRKDLDKPYSRYVDTSNPEVIPYLRRCGQTDYVFLVNDRREFGDYVGHHGLVMENGLPSEAVVSVNRESGFVYDLVNGCPVPASREGKKLRIPVRLGPCDGRVLMISSQQIDAVGIKAPGRAARGSRLACLIEVVDRQGAPVNAVVPVKVEVRDADGRLAELSGSYGAAGGKLRIHLDIAANDARGMWQIRARELASGRTAEHYFRVDESDQ